MAKYKYIDSTAFTAIKYIFDTKDFTFNILDKVSTKRTIFYSTVLAISSAVLIFIGQYITGNNEIENKIYIVISITSFTVCIMTLVLIHFINIIQDLVNGKTKKIYDEAIKVEPLKIQSIKNHKYFKGNQDKLNSFSNAIYIIKTIRSTATLLDFIVFLCVVVGVGSYSLHLFNTIF